MREPTIALLKHSEGLCKGLRGGGTERSEEEHSPSEETAKSKRGDSEGIPRKTLLKRSERALYATARAGTEKNGAERRNNGEERSEHTASLQNLQRNFGGISEESQRNLGETTERA